MYWALQGQNVQGLHMDSAAVEQVIDLRPYMNTSPAPIPETFSLDRAYRMFTQLGLRHLVVVDHHNHVKGIVTRKVRRQSPAMPSPDIRHSTGQFQSLQHLKATQLGWLRMFEHKAERIRTPSMPVLCS